MDAKEQHQIFMKWFIIYQYKLGLASWHIYDCGIQAEVPEEFKEGAVQLITNNNQNTVQVRFFPFKSPDNQTEEWFKHCALHEALHLLIEPLSYMPAIDNETINKVRAKEEHRIINTIISTYLNDDIKLTDEFKVRRG